MVFDADSPGPSPQVVDRSGEGRLCLTGPDRVSFLDGQSTAAVKSLEPGHGTRAAFVTGKGKMRGEGVILAESDRLWIRCDGAAVEVLAAHLKSFLIMDDVAIADLGAATVERLVFGSGAGSSLAERLGAAIADLAPYGHRRLPLGAESVLVVADRRLGVEGYAVLAAAAVAPALDGALDGIARIAPEAAELLRVEAGVPRWGAEMDEETIPIEVGLASAIDYQKGCFTGYEVLARIRTYGHVNRHLRGLRLAGDGVPAAGTEIRAAGKPVGRVTSAVRSERLGGAIALAMIRRESAAPGTALTLADGTAATVVELPFTS